MCFVHENNLTSRVIMKRVDNTVQGSVEYFFHMTHTCPGKNQYQQTTGMVKKFRPAKPTLVKSNA